MKRSVSKTFYQRSGLTNNCGIFRQSGVKIRLCARDICKSKKKIVTLHSVLFDSRLWTLDFGLWTFDYNNKHNSNNQNLTIMKKIFLFAAAVVAAMTINAQEANVVNLADVANYIDFQALSVSDPAMIKHTVTSTAPYELANGTTLVGLLKSDGTEAANSWNTKTAYNTTLPTPTWEGVDSLTVGTMFRAGSGTKIVLGSFSTDADGKLGVYYQPNGDSERGVSISVYDQEVTGTNLTGAGNKIDGVRPGYAGYIMLPAGSYDAGDVVIKMVSNTSNICGVAIENLAENTSAVENTEATVKAQKVVRNGQVLIERNGVVYTVLGSIAE